MSKDQAPEEKQPEAEAPVEADLKDVITMDFMKDIVEEMGLDINQKELDEVAQEQGIEDKDKDKSNDEKKEDPDKKE